MSAGYIIYSLDSDKFRQLVEQPTAKQLTALGKLLSDGLEEQDGEFDDGDPILEWPTDVKSLARIAGERLALPDWYGDLSSEGKSLWEGVVFRACMECRDIDVGFRVNDDRVYWDVIEIARKHLGVPPYAITDVALSRFGKCPFRYFPRSKPKNKAREREARKALKAMPGAFTELSKTLQQELGQQILAAFQGLLGPKTATKSSDQATRGRGKDPRDPTEAPMNELKKWTRDTLKDPQAIEGLARANDWSCMHSMHAPDEVQKMLAELESIGPEMQRAKPTKKSDPREEYNTVLIPVMKRIAKEGRMLFIQVDT